jgi:hypothetical protein
LVIREEVLAEEAVLEDSNKFLMKKTLIIADTSIQLRMKVQVALTRILSCRCVTKTMDLVKKVEMQRLLEAPKMTTSRKRAMTTHQRSLMPLWVEVVVDTVRWKQLEVEVNTTMKESKKKRMRRKMMIMKMMMLKEI